MAQAMANKPAGGRIWSHGGPVQPGTEWPNSHLDPCPMMGHQNAAKVAKRGQQTLVNLVSERICPKKQVLVVAKLAMPTL